MLPLTWENLSRCSTKLIHVCKKLPVSLDCRQNKFICKYIPHIFSILGVTFAVSFLCYFLHCTSICTSSKSMSQIFKILFQTGDINIFDLRGVFFSGYVRLKSSFPGEKNISVEIWDQGLIIQKQSSRGVL